MTEVSNVANTVLTALDIGSGVDSKKLARDLTDAMQIPQENEIQKQIDSTESAISAYGYVKVAVNALKSAFEKLNDANEIASSTGTSSDTTKMTISSLSGNTEVGSYDFTVSQLAQNQRVFSDQYTTNTHALNSGSAFDISISVGATESAVAAVYNATATASETTTLVVGDGTNTVSVASATYTSIADQVTAIQNASGYGNLLFTVGVNSDGDGIAFTYKTEGSVASTPTFTGTGSTHTITNPTVGVSVAAAVTGVAAEYNVTATAAESTTFVVSDGSTSVSVASASYSSIADQVTAIQGGVGYSNLQFTVSANDAGNGFKFTYKTTGAVTTAPTLTGTGSSHTVSTITTGITAVNSPTITTVGVATDTPAGVVSAINAANTGVKASLVDTGTGSNNYRIILSGPMGSQGVFSLSSSPDLGFHDAANTLQSAQDAVINYEGLTVTRNSNKITDVIDGATIDLIATTASTVTLTVNTDTSSFKTNIKDLVTTYNDMLVLFGNFTSVESEEETGVELSGSLYDDTSMVRLIKDKTFAAIFAESSTPSGSITEIRDLGLSINQFGTIILDEVKFDAAVQSNYSDIVTMLTADTTNQNAYDAGSKGLAEDVITVLRNFTATDGIIKSRETTSTSDLSDHEEELVKLEARMDRVYNRYLQQFGAMEALMATLDTTKDYLTSQFETLSKAYDVD